MYIKSLLSSPITARSAPVGTPLSRRSGSSRSGKPDGVADCPLPSETDPVAVIRIRWPFLTTKPELVQPFAVLSASTRTLKPIGGAVVVVVTGLVCEVAGAVEDLTGVLSVSSSLTAGRVELFEVVLSVVTTFCDGFVLTGTTLGSCVELVRYEASVGRASNSIEAISSAERLNSRRREPSPIATINRP